MEKESLADGVHHLGDVALAFGGFLVFFFHRGIVGMGARFHDAENFLPSLRDFRLRHGPAVAVHFDARVARADGNNAERGIRGVLVVAVDDALGAIIEIQCFIALVLPGDGPLHDCAHLRVVERGIRMWHGLLRPHYGVRYRGAKHYGRSHQRQYGQGDL